MQEGSGIFIVVEPLGIVAEDLAQCVLDFAPGAVVLVAADPTEALQRCDHLAAEDLAGPRAALVHADPLGFAETPLGVRLRALGLPVIFLGDRAEEAARSGRSETTLVLERPFSSDSVGAVLQQLVRSHAVAAS